MTATLTKSALTAVINTKGAELISLRTDASKEYIWQGDPAFWGKHSPVLFPIVGTLKNNQYTHNHRAYSLPRHGFARDMAFEITAQSEASATFSLQSSQATLAVYPFEFELQLIYTLTDSGLEIGYKVFNKTDETMPFSIGAHPAFALPGDFGDYALLWEKPEKLQFHLLENDLIADKTAALITVDQKTPLYYALFENDALVFKSFESGSVTILKDNQPMVKVRFADFPNLGIWTKPGAPFLCIEPWFGYADTLNSSGKLSEKEGIVNLNPHGNFETKFSIDVF